MACSAQLIGRLVILLALSFTVTSPRAEPAAARQPEQAQTALPPEVRLRKLHLVRPDLIPFPIAYEVCC